LPRQASGSITRIERVCVEFRRVNAAAQYLQNNSYFLRSRLRRERLGDCLPADQSLL